MDPFYESTEQFRIENFETMGLHMTRIIDSQGMVRAILSDEDFAIQYRLVAT